MFQKHYNWQLTYIFKYRIEIDDIFSKYSILIFHIYTRNFLSQQITAKLLIEMHKQYYFRCLSRLRLHKVHDKIYFVKLNIVNKEYI